MIACSFVFMLAVSQSVATPKTDCRSWTHKTDRHAHTSLHPRSGAEDRVGSEPLIWIHCSGSCSQKRKGGKKGNRLLTVSLFFVTNDTLSKPTNTKNQNRTDTTYTFCNCRNLCYCNEVYLRATVKRPLWQLMVSSPS